MDSFNHQFIYSVIIVGLGYILKQTKVIKERDGEGIARVIFNLTLPSLIIITFNNMTIDTSLILLVFISIGYGLISGFLGLLLFKNQQRQIRGTMAMMVPGVNIGLFAFPLVEGLWGKDGLAYFGMFDIGNAFMVFGLSYLIGSFYSVESTSFSVKTILLKMSKSIPFMTYISVFVINLAGLHLPVLLTDVSGLIAKANMPLSLLLLGIYLNFTFDKTYLPLIVRFLGLRYGVGLAVGVTLFYTLPFNELFRYTVLISFILPTSMSVLPYSVEFNYDRRMVGTVSNMTMVISFVLMWVIANILI
ncbi:AEC family transporter [Aquibacillus salsiterrae]|uniref:AEC family transporter n=1 Tax=Aquibacillus salsiterrae TaxID=2950439 RepID=A0A9X4AGJ2_9BACI|nr:AEC family transporter [Aquibacillus salsiterrae]MDC3417340.1 AEC family transporter [Aquibacillus salsiterrae]